MKKHLLPAKKVNKVEVQKEVKQDIIEKIEHTIVTLECIRATCDEEGLTEGKYCSVCNEVIRKQEVIKKQIELIINNLPFLIIL